MRDRKPKRERAREPETMPTAGVEDLAPKVPQQRWGPFQTTLEVRHDPPATWADVAMESARASRAAAEAASDIARTGHPEGVELVSQDPPTRPEGLDRADASQREVEWLRRRLQDAEWTLSRAYEGLRPTVGPIEQEGARLLVERFLNEEPPSWHIETRQTVGEEQGRVQTGYITVTQPDPDSLEHFQKMAKGQQKRAARLSEALAHMTRLHTKGKRAQGKMQQRISALQTALEDERMRADRAEGACERLSLHSGRIEREAQDAIDAEREQKDRVARYLREEIAQALGCLTDGTTNPFGRTETILLRALRDAYNPDEIPF